MSFLVRVSGKGHRREKELAGHNDVFPDIVNGFLFLGRQAADSDEPPPLMPRLLHTSKEGVSDRVKAWRHQGGSLHTSSYRTSWEERIRNGHVLPSAARHSEGLAGKNGVLFKKISSSQLLSRAPPTKCIFTFSHSFRTKDLFPLGFFSPFFDSLIFRTDGDSFSCKKRPCTTAKKAVLGPAPNNQP